MENKIITDNSTFKKNLVVHASILKQGLWFIVNSIIFQNSLNILNFSKVRLLRLFGCKVGKGVIIKPSVNIKYPWNLQIGNNSWVGEKVWIDNLAYVSIGNNVCISQGALLLTGNHNYKKSTFDLITGEIDLKDGVWIGAKAVVCPNVICESHSVLTVNSVATSNMNAFTIYQGNPALPVRTRRITQ